MKILLPTARYKRDLKRIQKRNWSLQKLVTLLRLFEKEEQLLENARPHKLSGEYVGLWECHIESDWLLIYDITDEEVLLVRTGTHADLFE